MQKWYVVQTQSNSESLACSEIKSLGFETYLPMFQEFFKNPKTGLESLVRKSLFPGYVFSKFDVDKSFKWPRINGCRGVVGVVGCGERSASPLPDGCVEAIREKCEILTPVGEILREIINFTPEMPLEIHDGTFKGHSATYCNHSRNRVDLLLHLLKRTVRVRVPISAVRPKTPLQRDGGSVVNPLGLK